MPSAPVKRKKQNSIRNNHRIESYSDSLAFPSTSLLRWIKNSPRTLSGLGGLQCILSEIYSHGHQDGSTHWSRVIGLIPSSRCGTTFSFRYTRAGAPPGRTWVAEKLERSPMGVPEPAPLVSVIAVCGFGAASADGAGGA